jgi:hypothetical protein
MLAMATLAVGLFGSPRPAHTPASEATCPTAPAATFVTAAHACPAIEISGSADADGVALDPAFDVSVAPAQLTRPGDGGALLSGFSSDGRTLFTLPVAANGAFHLYVPLGVTAQEALTRLTLAYGRNTTQREASEGREQSAEIIPTDESNVIVAWNAALYPAIRVAEKPDGVVVGSGSGTSTFEQLPVETRARVLYIVFSDGVRSFARSIAIFGR